LLTYSGRSSGTGRAGQRRGIPGRSGFSAVSAAFQRPGSESGYGRLELLLEPELSIVCFRYAASDAVNAEILLRLRRTTRSIPSSTVVAGQLAIRPCFINPHTQPADVDALVDHVIAIGDELTGAQPG
jgi:glutamate/tyrosine decarboxylase-like PLP-dependent enzyme